MSSVDIDHRDRPDAATPDDQRRFDVFLSYNSQDRPAVRRVAAGLRRRGLTTFFDDQSLSAGGAWPQELADGLAASSACAIFIGPHGLGSWTREEMWEALRRTGFDRNFRLFPVLLPGLDHFEPADVPPFLGSRAWVDLREGIETQRGMQNLVNAVLGVAPRGDAPRGRPGPVPYRGLASFDEEHAPFFFGREAYTQRLVEKLKKRRFVAVVGPSGSGKSSLVRAGLVPRLKAGAMPGAAEWHILILRPGAHPAAALAGALLGLGPGVRLQPTVDGLATDERTLHLAVAAALADQPPENRVLVLVDQCEELFTACRDRTERSAFLRNLRYAAIVPAGPTTVAITLRADFYARLAGDPAIAQLVQSDQLLLGGLTDDEFRLVIEEPARVAGLDVEEGLAETILTDVVRGPAALPLLEDALLETWRGRRGETLTLQGYRDTGGVRRALAERAEKAYTALDPDGREVARRLLLRLVQPGEGTEDTRRRVVLADVMAGPDRGSVETVVQRLVADRLLTTSADDGGGTTWIEVSHEALLEGWPRLRRWIDAEREGLLLHSSLIFASREWQRLGRDGSLLLRGPRLAETLAWRRRQPGWLNWVEDDFLSRSEESDRRARSARRRRRQRILIALSAAVAAISASVVVAVDRGLAADRERATSTSRRLAASAEAALGVDPAVALTLAERAVGTARTDDAERALRQAVAESRALLDAHLPAGRLFSAGLLPGGRQAVMGADDGSLQIWDTAAGNVVAQWPVHTASVLAVAAGSDGHSVASASVDGTVAVTDVRTGATRTLLRAPGKDLPTGVDVSGDGRLVAAATSGGEVVVDDIASGRELMRADVGDVRLMGVAFTHDGRRVAATGADGEIRVLDAVSGRTVQTMSSTGGALIGLDVSPDDRRIVTAGEDGWVRTWDATSGQQEAAHQLSSKSLYTVAFDSRGTRLVTSGEDGHVRVWDTAGVELADLVGHVGSAFDARFLAGDDGVVSVGADGTARTWRLGADAVVGGDLTSARLSPDGQRVVAGGTDGHVRTWSMPGLGPQLDIAAHQGRCFAAFSGDGKSIVSWGEDGTVVVWDLAGREQSRERPGTGEVWSAAVGAGDEVVSGGQDGHIVRRSLTGAAPRVLREYGPPVYAVQFSPDGRSVLSGDAAGVTQLWDENGSVQTLAGGMASAVNDVAFAPDGRMLAAASADGSVHVWMADGSLVTVLRGHEGGTSSVRFTVDGARLVTAGSDGRVRLWDVASAALLLDRSLYPTPASVADVSSDGRLLVSSSERGRVVLVEACEVCGPLQTVLDQAGSRPARPLTTDEQKRYLPDGE